MIGAIKSLWNKVTQPQGRVSSPEYTDAPQPPPIPDSTTTVRRFQSAETNRLNSAHWASLNDNHINADIASDLDTLIARCTFEATNNPLVDGVIRTHATDLITPCGPTLKVESSDENFNQVLEREWSSWFESPEIGGEISGVDLLFRWAKQDWTKGAQLAIFVTQPDTPAGEVSLRLMDTDLRRLKTPYDMGSDGRVLMGIRRDTNGRPQRFYIERTDHYSPFPYATGEYDQYPADDVLHAFESVEPGQCRGVPMLASCLEEIAQLRAYDTEVLDAARAAANNGLLATNKTPEAMEGATPPTSPLSFERGVVKWVPPGWELSQMQPRQPIAEYKDYRHEKLRSLGRPVHMPLLLVLLSAEESNFSQSRIDVNVFYERGLKSRRRTIEVRQLRPVFKRYLQELKLIRRGGEFVLPPVPSDMVIKWFWDPMPQADELKHMQAKKLRRQLHLSTPSQDMAEQNIDFDKQVDRLKKDREKLSAAGIDPDESTRRTSTNSRVVANA